MSKKNNFSGQFRIIIDTCKKPFDSKWDTNHHIIKMYVVCVYFLEQLILKANILPRTVYLLIF